MKEYKPGRYIISHKRTGMPIGCVLITKTGQCFEAFTIGTTDEYIGSEISKLRAFERLSAMERHYTVETLNVQEAEGQSDAGGEHLDGGSVLANDTLSTAGTVA